MVVQRRNSDSDSNELEDTSFLKENEMIVIGEKRSKQYSKDMCRSSYVIITVLTILCAALTVGLFLMLLVPKKCHVVSSGSKRSTVDSMTFFLLSDIHLDTYYNRSLTTLTLCRNLKTKNNSIDPTISPYEALYGRSGCDTSLELLNATADEIRKLNEKFEKSVDFVMITGDQAAHAYDEFQVDVQESVLFSANTILEVLSTALPYTPIFLVMGNNDMIHDYQPPVDWGNFFYESYAKIMMRYIFISDDVIDHNAKTDFVDTFKVGGFYKIYLKGSSLLLLILNTNYWITNAYQRNPEVVNIGNMQMNWLVKQLEGAEAGNKKVIIAGHIPPGCSSYNQQCNNWLGNYTEIYLNLTTRLYKDVIAVQFYGHTHQDKLKLLYQNQDFPAVQGEIMKSYMLLTPSITPIYENNPAFRFVTFNMEKKNIADYDQFYFDLVLSNVLKKPVWYKEYSFCKIYNISSINVKDVESLVHSLASQAPTWLEYSKHMVASYSSKSSSQRFIEYCSSLYLTSNAFDKCMKIYKNSLA